MADVITFSCTGCNKQYRVAVSYAGRDFACKSCGTQLSVPQSSQPPAEFESNVELGSGSQVIRGTTASGRQVSVDPTRVFANKRETSGRLAAVGALGEPASSSKGPLIAVAVVVAVILVGLAALGIAYFTGAFGGDKNAPTPVAQANAPTNSVNEESERSRILKQIDVPGQSAADFVQLLARAEAAKLQPADISTVVRAVVRAMLSEGGAGFSDADLMSYAARVSALNFPMDAEALYTLVIERGRAATNKSAEFKQAHEKLGHACVDVSPHIESAGQLRDSGVIEGMDALQIELLAMEERADQGWLISADKRRFDEIVKLLETARADYAEIERVEPFRIKAAVALRLFKLEKASGLGKWVTLTREPFVFFVQLHGGEDKQGAEGRLESALAAAEQFPAFYREQLIGALELKRMLPAGLSQSERDEAPFVIKLFRDASNLDAHLKELGVRIGVTMATEYTEPGTGHLSMAYDDHAKSIGIFVRALIDVVMYNHHPRAPTTKAEDDDFKFYSASFLGDFFHVAISYTGLDQSGGGFTYDFFQNDTRPARTLKARMQPFTKDTNGRISSFGGQVLTLKDFVTSRGGAGMRDLIKAKLATLEGWTEGDLMAASSATALNTILVEYYRGFYLFLYHWGPDGTPKYRDSFLKFVRADLAGEVDKDDPLPAFNKVFGLDDAGWKQFEADFTAYQS